MKKTSVPVETEPSETLEEGVAPDDAKDMVDEMSGVKDYIENCGSTDELDKIQEMLDMKREELGEGETEGPKEFSTEEMPSK